MEQRITELGTRVARLERRHAEDRRGRPLLFSPGSASRRLLPAATRGHLREARRQMLLALRALLDARIEGGNERRGEPRREVVGPASGA